MSAKEYLDIYDKMTDEEKEMMHELYLNAINRDGHSWVTFGAVEELVARIIFTRRAKPSNGFDLDEALNDIIEADVDKVSYKSEVERGGKNFYFVASISKIGF